MVWHLLQFLMVNADNTINSPQSAGRLFAQRSLLGIVQNKSKECCRRRWCLTGVEALCCHAPVMYCPCAVEKDLDANILIVLVVTEIFLQWQHANEINAESQPAADWLAPMACR